MLVLDNFQNTMINSMGDHRGIKIWPELLKLISQNKEISIQTF